jgi:DNA-binding NtrC family response regulator
MRIVRDICWLGDPAPKALADALRTNGVALHARQPAVAVPSEGAARTPRVTPATGETGKPRGAGGGASRGADRDAAVDADGRTKTDRGDIAAPAAVAAPWPRVCYTARGGRVPIVETNHLPWIWLVKTSPGEERCREALLAGAYDVIAADRADAAAQLIARLDELFVTDPLPPDADGLVTESDASRRVLAQVARVAPTAMPVLLTGETGTGKEVLARLIHAWSPRRAKQFVPVNCAAIPNELMEAELFGYARGAFSGAVQGYDGQLMAASGGTVFMDEIDDTPLATQVKLLRVLEDRIVSRLGENAWHQVDFRILAATNRDLRPLIEQGTFGGDLYERLAIVTIKLVPLRERVEDLPALARHFLARFAREQPQTGASRVKDIRADALRALQAYAWPGNIRELRNVLYETLVYKRAGEEILPADLPRRVLARDADRVFTSSLVDPQRVADRVARGGFNLRDEVTALQRAALEEALRRAGGNATRAARLLGTVGRGRATDPGGTVRAMMRRLDLDDRVASTSPETQSRDREASGPQAASASRQERKSRDRGAPPRASRKRL